MWLDAVCVSPWNSFCLEILIQLLVHSAIILLSIADWSWHSTVRVFMAHPAGPWSSQGKCTAEQKPSGPGFLTDSNVSPCIHVSAETVNTLVNPEVMMSITAADTCVLISKCWLSELVLHFHKWTLSDSFRCQAASCLPSQVVLLSDSGN